MVKKMVNIDGRIYVSKDQKHDPNHPCEGCAFRNFPVLCLQVDCWDEGGNYVYVEEKDVEARDS